jgi:D-threo-aldose 1-dehydrogenase
VNPTELVPIGHTGIRVTRLGLGLAPIGGLYEPVSEQQARDTVEKAWELGIRYFDTAPLYGNGRSETRAGAVLANKPRESFVLSTKVGRLLRPGGSDRQRIWAEAAEVTPVYDFSGEGVLTSYAESLSRLGLDRADLLHVHDPDDFFAQAVSEALPALVALREQGRIGGVSVGMNQNKLLTEFVRTGMVDCVLAAGRYTLLDQSAGVELLPLCAALGVSVIAGGVFNSGILADPRPGATYDYGRASSDLIERAQAISSVCDSHGVPLRAAAIQFPLTRSAVTSVLVGARSPAEVADAVEMASLSIPSALWDDLRASGLLT